MTLRSISPLEGRYAGQVEGLSDYFSEWALIRYRVRVEIEWLIMMSETREITHVREFSEGETLFLRSIVAGFDEKEAGRVKKIEDRTRHDVKAVEYYLRERLRRDVPDGRPGGRPFLLHLGRHQQPGVCPHAERRHPKGMAAPGSGSGAQGG